MEYDEMLVKHVGGMGKFQKLYIFSYFFFALAIFSPMVELIFQGLVAEHACSSPEVEEIAQKFNLKFDEILRLSAPSDEVAKRQQCHVVVRDYGNLTEDDVEQLISQNGTLNDQESLKKCTSWIYDRSKHGFLLAEKFDLVCDREWLLTQSQTYNMAGMLVGIFLFGWFGDRYGRKPAILTALVFVILSRLGGIFVPIFNLFVALRVVCLGTCMGFYTQGYLLGIEMVGSKWRSTTGLLSMLGFALVDAVVSLFAYLLRDYRWLMLADSVFLVPYVAYFWLLSESARWLFTTGRVKQGKAVLARIARINGVELPEEYEIKQEEQKQKANPLLLFKTKEIRKRTIVNSVLWFTISFGSYGLVFNAINLSGSVYINVLIMGATVVIAWLHCHFVLDIPWLGRRKNLCGTLVLSGACLLCMLLVPNDLTWLSITLYMIGKTAVTSSFNMIYILTPETMPTEIRSTGMSVASTCARVGGILAPYMALIGRGNNMYPSIILGVMTILTAATVFFLPETLGKVLPDTILQVEQSAGNIKKQDKEETAAVMLNRTSPSDC